MAQDKEEYYPGIEYQGLFNLMHEEHGLTLTQMQMDDILNECKRMARPEPKQFLYNCSVCGKCPGIDFNKNCMKCGSKVL